MVEGTRIHQHIQKQYKEGDRKEVYLKTEIAHEGLIFRIDGRCDGLLTGEDGSVTVEEIKSTASSARTCFRRPGGALGAGIHVRLYDMSSTGAYFY